MSRSAHPLPRQPARALSRLIGAALVAGALCALSGCQTMATVGRVIAGIEDPPPDPAPVASPVVSPAPVSGPAGAAAPVPPAAAPASPATPVPVAPTVPPAPAAPPAAAPVPAPVIAAPPAAAPGAAAPVPGELLPKLEPLHPSANRMYAMHGRTYWPITDDRPFDERGAAAIIERRRAGAATASGEPYDPASLSAGHPRLPIPSYARVTHRASGRSVLVRINDRGPVRRDRVIALSEAAAQRIGAADGDAVEIVRLTNAEILQMEAARRAAAPVAAAAPAAVAIPAPAAVAPAAPAEVLVPPVPTPPGAAAVPRPSAPAPQPAAPAATTAVVAPPPVPMPPGAAAAPAAGAPAAAVAPRPADAAGVPVAAPRAAPSPARPATAAASAAASAPAPAAAASAAAAAAATPPPAPRPAPSGRAPRWAVQIGAFAVQDNADTLSERAARQLASALSDVPASDRTPRVERRGNRFVVLVGDFGDLSRAEAHGLKVGGALRQNVTVVPR